MEVAWLIWKHVQPISDQIFSGSCSELDTWMGLISNNSVVILENQR